MKKIFLILSLIILGCLFLSSSRNDYSETPPILSLPQVALTYEGQTYVDTNCGTSYGVTVPKSEPTTFIFRNNYVTGCNINGYMLEAGTEVPSANTNNLKGEQIIGNKFVWTGDENANTITHGLFTGYNIDAVIKYNYVDNVPMSIIRKSNGLVNTTGGVAYNIIKNPPAVGVVVKGMSGVKIYNNTFYSDETMYTGPGQGTWRGLIDVYTNTDTTVYPDAYGVSHDTKIKNNIFYTKNQIYNINVMDTESLVGFESDYNVFFCEAGEPIFIVAGQRKTFTEWRALGYDAHSVVVNPHFNNLTDFVPATRLNFGTDLGSEFNMGLSTLATWTVGSSPALQDQNNTWQVGARVYSAAISYLLTNTNNVTIAAAENSTAQFYIISNTTWRIETSQEWLKVAVELYYSTNDASGEHQYVTMKYSGSAPDIGYSEFLDTWATGHDTAIVTLTALANTGQFARNASVTITGTDPLEIVPAKVVSVVQDGLTPTVPTDLTFIASSIDIDLPTQVIMDYNLLLANIVPDVSAFAVYVNGTRRNVTNIAFNGTKVILNLTSPIANGNTVALSYTVPPTNPLQSTEGSIADPISNVPVQVKVFKSLTNNGNRIKNTTSVVRIKN